MIRELVLNWVKCDGGAWSELAPNARWCALESVDLSSITESGVYVIWVAGRCVYVGQGRIADRLVEHRSLSADASWEILGYRRYGTLGVTWASVDEHDRDGIEAFLADVYEPLVGSRRPDVPRIPVNLP